MLKLLPNIDLIDDTEKTSKFHDLIKNKTVILNMFYSQCQVKCQPLCKLLRNVNLLLHNYIRTENITFISITLDSQHDTVSDINTFKNKVYDDRCLNWNFYTGNFNEIERLRYKLGMYSPEKEIDAVKSNHSGGFLIFNPKLGFSKHTEAFDNPIDIARKIIQMIPRNFIRHHYDLNDLCYDWLPDDVLFTNIKTMNSMFTVPFLPDHIKLKIDKYAEKQRGFNYKPPINKNKKCCCKSIC